jgi:hypothetical protein
MLKDWVARPALAYQLSNFPLREILPPQMSAPPSDIFAQPRQNERASRHSLVGKIPRGGDMTDKEQIDVIQCNVDAIRNELNSRIESDLKYGQTLLAGLAAVVVLKDKLTNYLPVAPLLMLALVIIWEQSEFAMFRLGKELMYEEGKINKIAGTVLLDYESNYWEARKDWFPRLKTLRLGVYFLLSIGAFWLIHHFMKTSILNNDIGTKLSTYVVASGLVFQIFNYFLRASKLFK